MTERYPARCQKFNQPPSPPPASIWYSGPYEMNSMPTATSPNSGTPANEAQMTMQPPQADPQIEGALIGYDRALGRSRHANWMRTATLP